MWAKIDRHVTHWRILVTGWVLLVLAGFPGYMSYDSCQQLSQARGLEPTTNWHPPIMAYIWRFCDRLIEGPFLMLALQSITLLAGMYLLLRKVMSERGAALAAVLILLSPPVLPPMLTIWKDSQMAGFLMLAIGLLTLQSRAARIAALVFIFLGSAQRHNAAAATLPIMVFLFVWKPDLVRWKRYGLAVAVWLAITVSAIVINSALSQVHENVVASLQMNDIAGIIRYKGPYSDDEIRKDAGELPWNIEWGYRSGVLHQYAPTVTWLVLAAKETGVFRYPKTNEEAKAISDGWRRMILAHPGAYLRHRLAVFLAELRVTWTENFYLWWGFTDSPDTEIKLGLHATHSWLQEKWFLGYWALKDTPLYWSWVYFLAGLVLVYLCRRDRIALTIVSSGVLCEGFLFIVAPAIDYRYSHWMVTCSIVGATYYIASRLVARRKRDEAVVGLAGEKPVLGGAPGPVA